MSNDTECKASVIQTERWDILRAGAQDLASTMYRDKGFLVGVS